QVGGEYADAIGECDEDIEGHVGARSAGGGSLAAAHIGGAIDFGYVEHGCTGDERGRHHEHGIVQVGASGTGGGNQGAGNGQFAVRVGYEIVSVEQAEIGEAHAQVDGEVVFGIEADASVDVHFTGAPRASAQVFDENCVV